MVHSSKGLQLYMKQLYASGSAFALKTITLQSAGDSRGEKLLGACQ